MIAGVLLAAFALPASARAAEPYFDVRDSAKAVTAPADTRAFERRLGQQAVVDLDPATRTPRVVAKLDGALTAPADGAAATIGLRYVRDHLAEFGLSEGDLDTLEAPTVETVDGIRQVRWRQAVDGVRAADSELRVNVTGDGRVLSVLGSPAHDLPADTTPELTAGEAVRAVQDDVGVHRSLTRRSGVRRVAYDDGTTANLSLFDGNLAWRVTYRAGSDAVYDSMVDARSGKVLRRANLVKSEAATGLVWDNHPGATYGGETRAVDLSPWLTSATTLDGPYAHAFMDLDDNDRIGPSEDVEAAPYAFTPFTGSSCDPYPCSWSGGTTWMTNRLQNAVQAFYLVNLFHDHLTKAPIGFNGFEGADKVEVQTDDGAAASPMNLNNANMFTPPDGQPPVMQMYLWQNAYRAMNGGDDASIVYHEYTHGLTNRLVVDADGAGALNSAQAGAMGEGFSDFYAKDFLVSQWPGMNTAAPGEVSMGDYTDRPGTHVIRNQALDCPVGAAAAACPGSSGGGTGGFTYGDFGRIDGSPEVHSDGEIWAETLWDLRDALGSTEAVRRITAALSLAPPEPSYLEMRNAILQADAALGGTDRNQIWSVFAKRGMGYFASADDGNDTTPLEDFSPPPAAGGPRGTITGTVTDALAPYAPLAGVTVGVGGNANGPDALAATTRADGTYSLSVPPGGYASIVVRGAGYERKVQSVTVAANETKTLNAALRRDWAARDGGAVVRSTAGDEYTSYGCGPGAAIDNSQSTAWSTDYKSGTVKPLVVELPGPVDITNFGIDPAAGCGDTANASLREYGVDVSTVSANGPWTPVASGAFSGGNGTLNLVPLTAAASGARWVRLRPISPRTAGATFLDVSEFAVYGRAQLPVPDTTIVSGPAEGTTDSDTTPTFAFSSTVAGSTFECSLDAGAYARCSSPYTLPDVGSGAHTLLVRAVNLNGDKDPTPASRRWTVDAGLPDATLDESPPDYVAETAALFTFTRSANASGTLCTFDAVEFPCDGSYAPRDLDQGPHTFTVRAYNGPDNARRYDPTPPTRTFTVDSQPPEPAISGANVAGDSVAFTFSAADLTAVTFKCTFNGNTAPCTSGKTYGGLADGTYTLHLVATDAAGNSASADRTATIASPAYETVFTSTPESAVIPYDDPGFAFGSPSSLATFECSVDGAAFDECESPMLLSGLAEGAHSFAVRAVGPGARRDATPARFNFKVDLTAPQTSITFAPPPILTTRDFALGFTANEPASFYCTLDGLERDCASPWLLSGLADGPHFVTVAAVDAAGNVDPTPERRDFTVSVPVVSATPTPTPTVTPAPVKPKALTGVTVAKTASVKLLKKQKKLRLTVRAATGAKVSVEARLGSKSLGKASRTGSGAVTVKLSASRLKAARRNGTITVRVTASGGNLTSVTQTVRVKLRT